MSKFKIGDSLVEINGHSGVLEVIELLDHAVIVKYSRLVFVDTVLRLATKDEIKIGRRLY